MLSFTRFFMAFAVLWAALAQPAAAQSLLRDAETEAFFRDASRPLIAAAGLSPANVDIVLLQDKSINAFVAGGQRVYIHSGLIAEATSVGELQGVIAHELGHVAGGHVIRSSEGAKAATSISLLSLIAGAAAMAMGAGEAGAAIMQAGQQAAMGKYLSFSRNQEASTDQAGAKYMQAAGISGEGTIAFFKKLQNQEFRYAIKQDDGYARTHPLNGERIATLEAVFEASPAWKKPYDPALEARFQRVKAKLAGYTQDINRVMASYPESNQSEPALYARGYAWHQAKYPDRAAREIAKLVAKRPHDPYYLELQGQVLLETGKPREALIPLRDAVARAPDQPLIAATLGHALISTEDKAFFGEAKQLLRTAVNRDNNNPFAWYQLGIVYAREGDEPRAALATAERYNLEGNPRLALSSATTALRGIPTGTPDWLRAQDISLVSCTEIFREAGGKARSDRPRRGFETCADARR